MSSWHDRDNVDGRRPNRGSPHLPAKYATEGPRANRRLPVLRRRLIVCLPASRTRSGTSAIGTVIPANIATNTALRPIKLGRPRWLSSSIAFVPDENAYVSRYFGYPARSTVARSLRRVTATSVYSSAEWSLGFNPALERTGGV